MIPSDVQEAQVEAIVGNVKNGRLLSTGFTTVFKDTGDHDIAVSNSFFDQIGSGSQGMCSSDDHSFCSVFFTYHRDVGICVGSNGVIWVVFSHKSYNSFRFVNFFHYTLERMF